MLGRSSQLGLLNFLLDCIDDELHELFGVSLARFRPTTHERLMSVPPMALGQSKGFGQVLRVGQDCCLLLCKQKLSLGSRCCHAQLTEVKLGEVHSFEAQHLLTHLRNP